MHFPFPPAVVFSSNLLFVLETQRPLLRKMYPLTRHITLETRGRLPVGMHGEIYGDVECRQPDVYRAGTENGGARWRDGRDGSLSGR